MLIFTLFKVCHLFILFDVHVYAFLLINVLRTYLNFMQVVCYFIIDRAYPIAYFICFVNKRSVLYSV